MSADQQEGALKPIAPARVAEEFGAQRRRTANEQAYQEMRARYDVVIEELEDASSAPEPAQ